jgi:hypothetical protein
VLGTALTSAYGFITQRAIGVAFTCGVITAKTAIVPSRSLIFHSTTLANTGHDTRAIQDWLGHRSMQHTLRYTELAPTRFKDFWRD